MDISQYFSQLGKKSASKMTPQQRQERARTAARSRWGQPKATPDSQCQHIRRGIQCPNKALENKKYCFTHANG